MVWICELVDAGGSFWKWLCEPCMDGRRSQVDRGKLRWLAVKPQMGPTVPWLTCDDCRAKEPEPVDKGAGERLVRAWTREPQRIARFVKDKKVVEMPLAEAAAKGLL